MTAVIREEPEPLERAAPRAVAPFRRIVERCLAKGPEGRYASTRDLARHLAQAGESASRPGVPAASAVPS